MATIRSSSPASDPSVGVVGQAKPSAGARVAPVELVAAVIAVVSDEPVIRFVHGDACARLPRAAVGADADTSLEDGLVTHMSRAAGVDLGPVEQLRTSLCVPDGDNRGAARAPALPVVTISYLALTREETSKSAPGVQWLSWYEYFPWEDWRRGKPAILSDVIEPRLDAWATAAPEADPAGNGIGRTQRMRMCFGTGVGGWDEEKVLERFELLAEAGLLDVAAAPAAPATGNARSGPSRQAPRLVPRVSEDDRRTIALAMGRLRAKVKSRPLIFDLMPHRFTLFELQRTVEAILGPHLHKQNFRRLVEHMRLVEPTDEVKTHTGGRPAKLFRFRQECLWEQMRPGMRVR